MARNDEDRAKRLAEALRANLHRRKAQSRGGEPAPAKDEAPAPRSQDD